MFADQVQYIIEADTKNYLEYLWWLKIAAGYPKKIGS